MALFVLCDPNYRNNVWCDHKLRGIQDEANRRREKIRIFTDITAFENAASKCDDTSSVILLFDAISYVQKAAPVLSRLKVHPIFTALVNNIRLPFQFSSISPDMDHSAKTIVDYLYTNGKKSIAAVGINPNSWSDISRIEAIKRYAKDSSIFYAKSDVTQSYRDFLKEHEKYDAVVCATDHLTISLLEFLKENGAYNKEQFFISYGDTTIAKLYEDGITSVTVNYYSCGKAAAETHFNRLKYGWSAVTILLKNELIIRGTTQNAPYIPSETPTEPVDLYPQIEHVNVNTPALAVGKIERILAVCDIADLRLIYCMLSDYSYENTATFCFMSVETAKYRIRKIREMLHAKNKAEAVALLKKYIPKERLFATIEEMEHTNSLLK